jgi:hypothetical protein
LHSPNDKRYPLEKLKLPPQPRRVVRKKDFSLPKPYRRQLFSEAPERLTRMQVSLLSFAGLMVTALLGVLTILAQETEHSPDGKPIVAARPGLADARPGGDMAPDGPVPPALRLAPKVAAMAAPRSPAQQGKAPRKAPPPGQALAAARAPRARPARKTPAAPIAVPAPAPDPDVVLISAILLLTPAPPKPAAPVVSMELAGHAQNACTSPTKDAACAELHKLKP